MSNRFSENIVRNNDQQFSHPMDAERDASAAGPSNYLGLFVNTTPLSNLPANPVVYVMNYNAQALGQPENIVQELIHCLLGD